MHAATAAEVFVAVADAEFAVILTAQPLTAYQTVATAESITSPTFVLGNLFGRHNAWVCAGFESLNREDGLCLVLCSTHPLCHFVCQLVVTFTVIGGINYFENQSAVVAYDLVLLLFHLLHLGTVTILNRKHLLQRGLHR